MLMNYLKAVLFLSLLAVIAIACGNNASDQEGKISDTTQVSNAPADVVAICLWSSVSLKETPALKGKYKNIMYLGEKAVFMGETVTDSTDKKNIRDFIKIKLTDGTQGWVQANMMSVGAKPFVLKEKSKLYKRPDILSAGKDEFDKMQFVVITENQGEWAKIKGKKKTDTWFKDGWIKTDKLIDSEIDITVAILVERAMLKDDNEKSIQALQEILDNPDLSSSIFIEDVQALTAEPANEVPLEEEAIEGE